MSMLGLGTAAAGTDAAATGAAAGGLGSMASMVKSGAISAGQGGSYGPGNFMDGGQQYQQQSQRASPTIGGVPFAMGQGQGSLQINPQKAYSAISGLFNKPPGDDAMTRAEDNN